MSLICRSMFPFPTEIGHVHDLKVLVDEHEFLLILGPIVIEQIPQNSRALPKLMKYVGSIVRSMYVLRAGLCACRNLGIHVLPLRALVQRYFCIDMAGTGGMSRGGTRRCLNNRRDRRDPNPTKQGPYIQSFTRGLPSLITFWIHCLPVPSEHA